MKKLVMLFAAVVTLLGCAANSLNKTGSLVIPEVEPGSFTVNFCGNAYMTQKDVEKYAYQRASEVTIRNKYSYFLVLDKKNDSEVCSLYEQENNYINSNVAPNINADDLPAFARPNMTLKIQCFKSDDKIPEKAVDASKFMAENFPGMKK